MLSGGAPFRRDPSGAVHDSAGERLRLLHQTLDIFSEIATDPRFADTEVAYVSRTEYPEWALPALKEVRVCAQCVRARGVYGRGRCGVQ